MLGASAPIEWTECSGALPVRGIRYWSYVICFLYVISSTMPEVMKLQIVSFL